MGRQVFCRENDYLQSIARRNDQVGLRLDQVYHQVNGMPY